MNGKRSPSRRRFLKLSSTIAVGTALGSFSSFAKLISPVHKIERAAFTMGSIVTITAYCDDTMRCNRAIDMAFHEMKQVDTLMSVFNAKSQLSLINQKAGRKEAVVDHQIIEVLEHARKFSHVTDNSFDVTIEPLMELYGFRDDNNSYRFPSDKQIADTLAGVGMNNVTIDAGNSTLVLEHENTKLDFGGIAVGYAIDRAAGVLKAHGIESALINHSGDLYALGTPPDEDGWEIGITDPMHTDDIITTVRIKNQALSTSGNYQNFIRTDEKTIGHILNPVNGRTASSILSGTVIADTALEADAFSTGFFVLGIEKSKTVIQQSKNMKFIAVVKNGDGEAILQM